MSEESAEAAVSENERNMAVFRAGYVGIATNIALASDSGVEVLYF